MSNETDTVKLNIRIGGRDDGTTVKVEVSREYRDECTFAGAMRSGFTRAMHNGDTEAAETAHHACEASRLNTRSEARTIMIAASNMSLPAAQRAAMVKAALKGYHTKRTLRY